MVHVKKSDVGGVEPGRKMYSAKREKIDGS
jgi:hypothetical protein